MHLRPLLLAALAALTALLAVASVGHAATVTVRVGAGGDDRINTTGAANAAQGDTAVFAWEDGGHDLVVGGPDGTNVGEQDRGFKLTRKLERAGSYTLACSLHDNMTGKFEVKAVAGAPEPTAPPAVDVVVGPDGDGGFDPSSVSVVEGQTVNWHWGDDGRNVTFADGPASGNRSVGGSHFGRTFTKAGTYTYRDTAQGSTGTVTVRAAGAGGADGIRTAPAGTTPNARITVGPGNSFSPSTVAINEGGTVEWSWAGGPHNVRFTDGTDSGFRSSGTQALKFYKPGSFSFLCSAHSGMSGTVTVADTGTPGANEEPPAETAPPGGTPPADTGGSGDPTTTPAATVSVGGAANIFAPADVTVSTGQTVTFNWLGGVHNVHFADGRDSGVRSTGTWSRRMLNPGTFTYACDLHAGMTGRVVAEGAPVAGVEELATDDRTAASETTTTTTTTTTGRPSPTAGASTATAAAAPATTAAADLTAPALGKLLGSLRAGSRSHRLRVTVAEDAMLQVKMQRLGRSRDLVARRSFTLYARQGTTNVRMPVMNLAVGSYRLTIVAVDRAGNRSKPQTFTVKVGR